MLIQKQEAISTCVYVGREGRGRREGGRMGEWENGRMGKWGEWEMEGICEKDE